MSKKAMTLASTLAAATSRRGFLGGLGRLAAGTAMALAAMAAGSAHAAPKSPGLLCCWYCYCLDRDCERITCNNFCTDRGRCPQRSGGHRLSYAIPVASCSDCY